MKFGGRVVSSVDVLEVPCVVETLGGQRAMGLGSMTMGNAWSWPSSKVSSDETLAAIEDLAQRYCEKALATSITGHPLEICHQLAHQLSSLADAVVSDRKLPEAIPQLAWLLAASPLEAALFDGHGKALGASSYQLLGKEFVSSDLQPYLGDDFKGLYLDQFVSPRPQPKMPLYHLVGALDPLTDADVESAVNDGYPETLAQWIEADGLSHLKIKLAGDDMEWDVQRVTRVSQVASESSRSDGTDWHFSLDFNERCSDQQYVIEMLDAVERNSAEAIRRIQYVEQPTHRDLARFPNNTMHEVTKRLPVVIDESLVDLQSLYLSRELGYSGIALKACKGHAEALLMGAAAQHYELFLCVQDLTCVGANFLHSASLASHIPTVAAIEGNGRQYCPQGNSGWNEKFPGMFQISDGTVETALLDGPGLGYGS
ncbi:MAG: mandelate racemase/muconate lactonizing enzyme family protein [Pirellulaceae bacterium]